MSSSIAEDLIEFRERFGLPRNLSMDDLYKISLFYIKTGQVCVKCGLEFEDSFSEIPLPSEEEDEPDYWEPGTR